MSQPDSKEKDIASVLAAAMEPPKPGAHTFEHEVDLAEAGVDLRDTSEEDAMLREGDARDGVVVPPLPEPTTMATNSAMETDPVAEAKRIVDQAFNKDFDFGRVEVTPEERARFLRSGLHDTAMWYDILVPGLDVTVKVVIAPEAYTAAAMSALDRWEIGNSQMQWLQAFQIMHIWMQVVEFDGQPTNWISEHADEEGRVPTNKLRELLSERDRMEALQQLSPVRWQAIRLAVRIAEHKNVLCTKALMDRTFFMSAGTG